MLRFDPEKVFEGLRKWHGELSQQQVDGVNFILSSMEKDPHLTRLSWAAYMFATTYHETAHTYQPIHEYGGKQYFTNRYGGQTALGRRLGNDTADEGWIYAGRGDVQLTGEGNYEKSEDALRREYPELVAAWEKRTGKKFDLTVGDQPGDINDPNNAQDPEIAYAIMSYGMRTGMFTGLSIGRFLNDKEKNYKGARKTINGIDKDELIAQYAVRWETILRYAWAGDKPLAAPKPAIVTSAPAPVAVPQLDGSGTVVDLAVPVSIPEAPPAEQSGGAIAAAQQQLSKLQEFLPGDVQEQAKSGLITAVKARFYIWAQMALAILAAGATWLANGGWIYVVALIALGIIGYQIYGFLVMWLKNKDRDRVAENERLKTEMLKLTLEIQKMQTEQAYNKTMFAAETMANQNMQAVSFAAAPA